MWIWYSYAMPEESLVTLKVTFATRDALRMIAAMTGKKQYEVVEEAVREKLDRVRVAQKAEGGLLDRLEI